MTSEKEKMLAGQLYDAGDSDLLAMRLHARKQITLFNIMKKTVRNVKKLSNHYLVLQAITYQWNSVLSAITGQISTLVRTFSLIITVPC